MTTVMDALIRYHDENDPSATPSFEGTEASSPTDPAPDHPSLSSSTDDTASIPTPSIPATTNPNISVPIHSSSSGPHSDCAAAVQPLLGSIANLKLDSVLIRWPADGTTQPLDWADVLMTAELTSRKKTLELTSQIKFKALAMFDAQPNRAFSYSLSFHAGQYRLYMYDRAGGIYSRSYDLHESPLALLRILCATAFAPTLWLGMDVTFDCRPHPVITIDTTQYFIIAKCFSSSVIWGQATNVWFVAKSIPAGSDPNNIFVVKDSWVNVERQLLEEQIFEALKDVECVPKVKEAWTIQRDGQDDSTSLCHPVAFMSHFNWSCDHQTR
ncbi:hypothetical protein PISMIDRAFT_16145 [Pisolithus microcarpus 441]|uniref:Fungal-type protein kinase domain-containing protein n=1 Tax=Pisolithus microcarpus 441 TaxID=765257 RepID=A0A0C9YQ95_9AGAM|nr:hypothetical protein PISMIDRAFT_16145 [Pisolithus microcarpus 441]